MYKINFWNKKKITTVLFFIAVAILFLPGLSCQTGVKKFGSGGGKIQDPNDPSERNPLRIATGLISPDNVRRIAAYGEYGSKSEFLRACGFAGRSCICEFFNNKDGNDPIVHEEEQIAYDSVINLFYCDLPITAGINTVSHIRIRNRANTSRTNVAIIKTTDPEEEDEDKILKAKDLLAGLPLRGLRRIYEYACFFNYLEKEGTTANNFSCSDGSLAVLQIPYHYYLFSSNGNEAPFNNFNERVPDLLYNDGTGSLCQETLREIDCTTLNDGSDNPNAVTLRFGIFTQSIGFFTEPVVLSSAPATVGGTKTNYGFAVPTNSGGTCPPGFALRRAYAAAPEEIENSTIDNGNTDDGIGSPLNSIVVDVIIRNPNNQSTLELLVDRFGGGFCRTTIENIGEECKAPNINRDEEWVIGENVQKQNYKPESSNPFCVIPSRFIRN